MTSARGKSFLDTNIFVYTFDLSAPSKRAKALTLVGEALESRNGIISYQVVQEFLNVATWKYAPTSFNVRCPFSAIVKSGGFRFRTRFGKMAPVHLPR